MSRFEKFILFPKIIVTFILFSAYESKIIAYMKSFPHVPSPRSFQDLLQAGITVQVESNTSYGVSSDPQFGKVFKYDIDLTNEL